MGRTDVEDFADDLACTERSPLTIKNYCSDLLAFATWFREANGEVLTPAHLTPTDLQAYKRWLVDQRRLKPSSVNRKLAVLRSFLAWAARTGLLPAESSPPCPKRSHRSGGDRGGSIAASSARCAGRRSAAGVFATWPS